MLCTKLLRNSGWIIRRFKLKNMSLILIKRYLKKNRRLFIIVIIIIMMRLFL
jgi:hypothetical protein